MLVVAVSCRSGGEATEPVATGLNVDAGATTTSVESAPVETTPAESSPAETAPAETAPAVDNQFGPGDHVVEVSHGGRARRYIIHVPESVVPRAPVMMALHGGGGTGEQFQDENGLDAVSDREGFIAVYPEGSGVLPNRLHTWNSGDSCCGFAFDRNIDDVGFLRAVIEDLGARMSVDPERMYITGHSNGAMMAYRMAAEASDVVTAVIPVAGAMDIAEFAPSAKVAVLHIHSLDDPRALYDGGEGPPFPGTERIVNHESVVSGIERWAEVNGCGAEPAVSQSIAGAGDDEGQTAELLVWSGCAEGAEVEHLRLSGSGHGWPGVEVRSVVQDFLGPPTTLVDASEEAWAFADR